jgi:putative transposase
VHLLLSESGTASPAKIIQSFKQRVSRALRARNRKPPGQLVFRFPQRNPEFRRFWQRRYYDFNVYSLAKMKEKLHYMHENPVRAKLVKHPGKLGTKTRGQERVKKLALGHGLSPSGD